MGKKGLFMRGGGKEGKVCQGEKPQNREEVKNRFRKEGKKGEPVSRFARGRTLTSLAERGLLSLPRKERRKPKPGVFEKEGAARRV